jgi:hypothetical protein
MSSTEGTEGAGPHQHGGTETRNTKAHGHQKTSRRPGLSSSRTALRAVWSEKDRQTNTARSHPVLVLPIFFAPLTPAKGLCATATENAAPPCLRASVLILSRALCFLRALWDQRAAATAGARRTTVARRRGATFVVSAGGVRYCSTTPGWCGISAFAIRSRRMVC